MSTPADPVLQNLRRYKRAGERRAARMDRRRKILEDFAGGLSRAEIAAKLKVSVKTVYREIERGLDAQRPLSNERFVQLQVARLHRALGLLEPLLEQGQVSAATPMLAIFDRLDRYHGLQRRPHATNPLPPAAPLALTDERAALVEMAPHRRPSRDGDEDAEAQHGESGQKRPLMF